MKYCTLGTYEYKSIWFDIVEIKHHYPYIILLQFEYVSIFTFD